MRILILPLFLFLAACGQSGDLYLPEDKPAPVAATQPAPAADEPKKEDEELPKPAPTPAPASP